MDDKVNRILDLTEDNGDTFAMRAEMYYQNRPQLIQMVQHLRTSYHALADKYYHLKSESSIKPSNNGSLSNSFRNKVSPFDPKPKLNINNSPSIEALSFSYESTQEFSAADSESATSNSNVENLIVSDDSTNKPINTTDCHEYHDKKNIDFTAGENGLLIGDKVWNEQMKFSKLLEESLCKQAELIRRNNEKRDVINELRIENRILSQKSSDSSIRKSTMKGKQSQKGKMRGFFCFA
ncbi:hypothetical protein DH2020_003849 [Rehmannia glutinosa]|uniref:NAB domain-containing protein n=1 Tax=Rehmannia glutinosa TaxID=99300 RepID=A0ABR0XN48_REHGL